ncbi:MAG TPA: DUF4337 domain-containing protein [Kofleriaceae bacterium]|nr:DUF4337 domain-containing protein [Kofleriaceae bacterium]
MPEEIEVPTEHLHEKMEEEAEHGRRWIVRVAVSSALLAVAAAISALFAGGRANEAILKQMQATDQWAFYQAKGIKSSVTQAKLDTLDALGKPAAAEEKAKIAKYDGEQKQIEEQGHALEDESELLMHSHEHLALAVTFFQIAIAIGAISVLAKIPLLWFASLGAGAAGILFMAIGLV